MSSAEKFHFRDASGSNIPSLCPICHRVISGPIVGGHGFSFHPECFRCTVCGVFFEEGQSFSLTKNSQQSLHCDECAAQLSQEKPASLSSLLSVPLSLHSSVSSSSADGTARPLTVPPNRSSSSVGISGYPEPVSSSISSSETVNVDDVFVGSRDCIDSSLQPETVAANDGLESPGMPASCATDSVCGGEPRHARSSSLPRALARQVSCDALCRTHSCRDNDRQQRVFRPSDLVRHQLLGSGFFGRVYKVKHRTTGEQMVVKELYRLEESAEANFLKEVALMRSLNHPNVLRFIGVMYCERRLHLVTELIGGGSLWQRLHSPPDLPPPPLSDFDGWRRRVTYCADIASGMSYLHRNSVIHRDLNSHNCLVRQNGGVVVADFGLARVASSSALSTVDRRRLRQLQRAHRKKRYTVVGNPFWMAPEMMCGRHYDQQVDVFSFGIILCEVMSGEEADPDVMPRRSADFGLDEKEFERRFGSQCPSALMAAAFQCCHTNSNHRPPFSVLESWLLQLRLLYSSRELVGSESAGDRICRQKSLLRSPSSSPPCRDQRQQRLIQDIRRFSTECGRTAPVASLPPPMLCTLSDASDTYLCVDSAVVD